MYPVSTLQSILSALSECSSLFPIHEWINVLRIIDKLPSWKLRSKAANKIYPILEAIRNKKCDLKAWRSCYRLFHLIGDWFTLGHNEVPLYTYNPSKVVEMVRHFKEPSTKTLPVVLTMTSCKRLDLLTRTIDSMLENCLDLQQHVREWIIIDDNSSAEDRMKMKQLYPFMRFIDKSQDDKGHPRSMNLLRNLLISSNAKYNLHIEDDFEWWYPDHFITKCMAVITQESYLGQTVINFEYTEDQRTAQNVWNRDMFYKSTKINNEEELELRYFIHEHYTGQRLNIECNHLGAQSSMYWPHFTFRVGITKIDVYRRLGPFNEQAQHFEMEYANRYVQAGFKTAMLDCCYTTHIGRRTYERNSNKLNAYDLNLEQQFGSKPKTSAEDKEVKVEQRNQQKEPESNPKTSPVLPSNLPTNIRPTDIRHIRTWVINLKRRPERLIEFITKNNNEIPSFEVFEAVDGAALQPHIKIQKIFETGDYNFRRGIVGCAYSHIKIWSDFLKGKAEIGLVLEDDVTLVCNFREKLLHLITAYQDQFDVMFLHWNPYHHVQNKHELYSQFARPTAERWSPERSSKDNMGSTAGYIITRKGAKTLLQWTNVHGAPNAVDWNMYKRREIRIMYCTPMIVFGPCWNHDTQVQSDVQRDYNSVKYNSNNDMMKAEILRWINCLQAESNPTKGVVYDGGLQNELGTVLEMPHIPSSIIKISNSYPRDWKEIQQRIYVVPSTEEIPLSFPVKWYRVGAFQIVVPDVYITKARYLDIVWFNNRLNFNAV